MSGLSGRGFCLSEHPGKDVRKRPQRSVVERRPFQPLERRGVAVKSQRMQRLRQSRSFQTHVQAGVRVIHHEVDAASKSTSLSARLRQRWKAVTELVMPTAIDGLGIPTLTGGEALGDQHRIERAAHRSCGVHEHIVSVGHPDIAWIAARSARADAHATRCGFSGSLMVGCITAPKARLGPPFDAAGRFVAGAAARLTRDWPQRPTSETAGPEQAGIDR